MARNIQQKFEMKRKIMEGLIAIAVLMMIGIFAGCVEIEKEIILVQEVTALDGKPLADDAAMKWHENAALIAIAGPDKGVQIQRDDTLYGIFYGWAYLYKNANRTLTVRVSKDGTVETEEGPSGDWVEKQQPIQNVKIDSNHAIDIAVKKGGIAKDCFIELSMWKFRDESIVPLWVTPCYLKERKMFVRADTGEILYVEEEPSQPGFETIFSIVVILVVAYLLKRRRK